jgi:DNA-binding winged helix-turn-helix (wHTH) protein
MESGDVRRFGAFRLTGPHGPLWQGDTTVPLAPKALAVLWTLVTHAGKVVTKDTLLEAVWGATIVSEGTLSVHLRQVRQALGDSASTPNYIETVHRIGYRFIAKVVSSGALPGVRSPASEVEDSQSAILNPQSAMTLVGREAELAQLHQLYAKALAGERQIVFVTGEAGIGKTSLIDAFLTEARSPRSGVTESLAPTVQSQREDNQNSKAPPELSRRVTNQKAKVAKPRPSTPDPWITRGQCIEHYGAGEAYLPVLEAVGRLCRRAEGNRVIRVLHQYEPSWLFAIAQLAL